SWTTSPVPCVEYRATVTCDAPPSGPANDSCANAIVLPCNQMQTYTNVNAGSGPEDTALSCSLSGQRAGTSSVGFRFRATGATATLTTCPAIAGGLADTMLAVYAVGNPDDPCASLTEIGCNDDFCGGASQVSLGSLTVGTTYYVKVCGKFDVSPRQGQF